MRVHILGICGTFMGGVAALAKAAGHKVSGSDRDVYPPMSTQLKKLGIKITTGDDPAQFKPAPDVVIVGNVMSRGHPLVEELLNRDLPYTSGPQWLSQNVLQGRWVLAVAGTHGKTTTASVLAWILESVGLKPGFLIGGLAGNFEETARYGDSQFFVVEADEYDTAFFDKRAKFVHYRPKTLVMTNLEHDHADIYPDIASIQRQFHQLIRTVPGNGRIIVNAADERLMEVLALGCWTPRESYLAGGGRGTTWHIRRTGAETATGFDLWNGEELAGQGQWSLPGQHNLDNALAAVLAARDAGVPLDAALEALAGFRGVRRRLELRGEVAGVRIYDDFAHHPTAIRSAIAALRSRMVTGGRLIAVLEPRSNSMKMGIHRDTLAPALAGADRIWLYRPADLTWDLQAATGSLGERVRIRGSIEELADELLEELATGDEVLIMSNGGFGGLHRRLMQALESRTARMKRLEI